MWIKKGGRRTPALSELTSVLYPVIPPARVLKVQAGWFCTNGLVLCRPDPLDSFQNRIDFGNRIGFGLSLQRTFGIHLYPPFGTNRNNNI